MSEFIEKPSRSIELPLGCKDLIDVQEVRTWTSAAHPGWGSQTTDKLAYMEGYLTRLLESSGKATLVGVSRHLDRGQVMVIPDADLAVPVIFASWNGAAQEQALQRVFEEASLAPVTEPVGRWKAAKRSLRYKLPTDPSAAARFIGEVFRAGYGLGDLSSINLSYREPKVA